MRAAGGRWPRDRRPTTRVARHRVRDPQRLGSPVVRSDAEASEGRRPDRLDAGLAHGIGRRCSRPLGGTGTGRLR